MRPAMIDSLLRALPCRLVGATSSIVPRLRMTARSSPNPIRISTSSSGSWRTSRSSSLSHARLAQPGDSNSALTATGPVPACGEAPRRHPPPSAQNARPSLKRPHANPIETSVTPAPASNPSRPQSAISAVSHGGSRRDFLIIKKMDKFSSLTTARTDYIVHRRSTI